MPNDHRDDQLPDSNGMIRYEREMGLTHADFHRLLPRAMRDVPYTVDGSEVSVQFDNGSALIAIGPQLERRIALLRLPYAVVSFTFNGVAPERQQRFKQQFDRAYQRGGG